MPSVAGVTDVNFFPASSDNHYFRSYLAFKACSLSEAGEAEEARRATVGAPAGSFVFRPQNPVAQRMKGADQGFASVAVEPFLEAGMGPRPVAKCEQEFILFDSVLDLPYHVINWRVG